MAKNISFTVNSLTKVASWKQRRLAISLFLSKQVDLNKVFNSARWDGSKIVYDGPTATLGQIIDSRKATKEDGTEYNSYYVWDAMNVVDAGTVIDYLINAPIKGSNNGTVAPATAVPVQSLGFGGIAK